MDDNVLKDLYNVVMQRKENFQEGSYTCYLFSKGIDKILKKVGEESAETIIAAKNTSKEDVVNETSDLIYHLTVMLAEKGISWDDVLEQLDQRSHKIGNLKTFKQSDHNT